LIFDIFLRPQRHKRFRDICRNHVSPYPGKSRALKKPKPSDIEATEHPAFVPFDLKRYLSVDSEEASTQTATLDSPPDWIDKEQSFFVHFERQILGALTLEFLGSLLLDIPEDIDIAGEPSLRCNCRKLIARAGGKSHLLLGMTAIAADISRLRKSASLGCNICTVLLSSTWSFPHNNGLPNPLPATSTIENSGIVPQVYVGMLVKSPGVDIFSLVFCAFTYTAGIIYGTSTV
jgi:hypothetical protein